MVINKSNVSSPQSTGAAGVYFEQHVAAFFLGLLLVRGIPPVLKSCRLEALHLQARHLGWHTDDLLLVATETGGETRHLAAQVKRGFVVSASDEECRKTFVGFWNDFQHNPRFHPDSDALALLVLRGTDILPESVRRRHGDLPSADLLGLAAHSATVLNGIHTTVGETATLPRESLLTQVLEALDEAQAVILAGPAGIGKSVLARMTVARIEGVSPCFAFRAEEFATSHIDQTLHGAQIATNAERLFARLCAQGRKLILVESVERLLEASVRDALTDLLRYLERDASIRLLMT